MKVLAIIINIFFPGIGTMIIGKVGTGILQLVLVLVAVGLSATGVLSIVGLPLGIGVWIWALVSVAKSDAQNTVLIREVVKEVPVENGKED